MQLCGALGGGLALASGVGYSLWEGFDELPQQTSPYADDNRPKNLDALILIIRNKNLENPFGEYLGEILRAEGIPCFRLMDWEEVGDLSPERFRVILLTEGELDRMQVERLSTYVYQGGRLIAFRPGAQLTSILGLEPAVGSMTEGYLKVNPSHPLGRGIEARAMQYHGEADYYRLAGAEVIAWLANEDDQPTDYPAVTLYRFGKGAACAWSFDLVKSVVLSRQGNPAWANQERDGRDGIRAVDMFVGWMDLDRLEIPHADEQMRLLSRLMTYMLQSYLPLPRLGYFPEGKRGVLIATGDSHQNPPQVIEQALTLVEGFGGRMSIYHTPPLVSKLRRIYQRGRAMLVSLSLVSPALQNSLSYPAPSQVADWRGRGHEFSLHPYVEMGLEAGWQEYLKNFIGLGYGPISPTVRTHRILWNGWVETPRLQASYGIRMNLDFYHYGTAFRKASGEWAYGFFNASGLPMKFVDEQGRVLNIYQQVTQLVDEHLMKMPWGGGWADLSAEEAVQVAEWLIQGAAEVGAALAAQYHVDLFAFEGDYAAKERRWMEGSLAAAAQLGFPIWSAETWCNFTEMRQQARMTGWSVDTEARRLVFSLECAEAPQFSLALMLPQRWEKAWLDKVWVDQAQVNVHETTHAGLEYGWFPVSGGKHQIVVQYAE